MCIILPWAPIHCTFAVNTNSALTGYFIYTLHGAFSFNKTESVKDYKQTVFYELKLQCTSHSRAKIGPERLSQL